MSQQQWWRRFLPDSSRLALVASLVVIAVAALGFLELYGIKAEAEADHNAAQEQVRQLREQNLLLQEALIQGQRGDNVETRAREYFKLMRPGETKIVFRESASLSEREPVAPASTPAPAQLPIWRQWVNKVLSR